MTNETELLHPEIQRCMNVLRLEVPSSIVDDIIERLKTFQPYRAATPSPTQVAVEHPVCTDHTCKGYRTRHEHASPTQVAGIGEHRIAKAARALITAVTFAGASDLPNDAGEGYMARVPMQFISDMEAALADLHISSKPIKDEDDALYHMIIDIITPLLPHEVYGNIESAAEAILPHLAPQEDVKVTTEQAHKELYAMIDEANVKALVEASDAVVKRWDSPKWKDLPHTADYIHALRNALTPFLHTTDDKQRGEK